MIPRTAIVIFRETRQQSGPCTVIAHILSQNMMRLVKTQLLGGEHESRYNPLNSFASFCDKLSTLYFEKNYTPVVGSGSPS
jgi:hypothetical protein